MRARHFLKCTMINFAEVRRQAKENEEYTNVLKDIGVDVSDASNLPLDEMPIFPCLVDMDTISQVSPLVRPQNKGFLQVDYKDGSTNYIKGRFDVFESIMANIATVHDFE